MEKENMQQGVTFVTCYYKIYKNEDEPFPHKDISWRIEQFEYIASTGVNICLYGDEITTPYLIELTQKYKNIVLLTLDTPYKETDIYKMCVLPDVTLPEICSSSKDTVEYMALMNSKIEFVHDALKKNPFQSRVFSWMDFSMTYMFQDKIENSLLLKTLSERTFVDTFMAVPGCWSSIYPDEYIPIINSIYWRFLGTFFIGDVNSISMFYELYKKHFPQFIEQHKKIVWEVNFWSWLESNKGWNPNWYKSDHNDSIIHLPDEIFV